MIEVYNNFVCIVSDYLIKGIFISVLVVWLAKFFKNVDIQHAKSILKWIMIGYGSLVIINYAIILIDEYILRPVEYSGFAFGESATGEFWFSLWVILISCTVLPFILISKRIGNKLIFLLLVAALINTGWLMNSFVIHVTSIHRDYIPEGWRMNETNHFLPYEYEFYYLLRGLILGLVVLSFGNWLQRTRNRSCSME